MIAARRTARAIAALILAFATAGGSAAAQGATAVSAGWWTAAPIALAPDASEGALLVQGGATGALSYAAVSFTLGVGEAPPSLTLRIDEEAVSTPNATMALCPLTGAFEPAAGGAVADAPPFDCTQRIEAPVLPDGKTFRFDVRGLLGDGRLAVAVLPTAPTDRVVLAAPVTTDLSSAAAGAVPSPSPPGAAGEPVPAGQPAAGGQTSPVPLGGGGAPPASPRPGAAAPVPVVPVGPTPAAAAGAAPAAAAGPFAAGGSLLGSEGSGSGRLQVLFLALAAAAAFLWLRPAGGGDDLAPQPT